MPIHSCLELQHRMNTYFIILFIIYYYYIIIYIIIILYQRGYMETVTVLRINISHIKKLCYNTTMSSGSSRWTVTLAALVMIQFQV